MLMRSSVVCIALFGGLLGAASPAQAQAGPLHPTLFLSEADLRHIQNVCPDTGQVLSGFPYDQVVNTLCGNDLDEATMNLALAFRLSGNRHYGEAVWPKVKETE